MSVPLIHPPVGSQVEPMYFDMSKALTLRNTLQNDETNRQLNQMKMQVAGQEMESSKGLRGLLSSPDFSMANPDQLKQVMARDPQLGIRLMEAHTAQQNNTLGLEQQKRATLGKIGSTLMQAWDAQGRAPEAWEGLTQQFRPMLQNLGIDPGEGGWDPQHVEAASRAFGGYTPQSESIGAEVAKLKATREAELPYKLAEKNFLSADAQRQAQAQENAAGMAAEKDRNALEMKLSDDFNSQIKTFQSAGDAYKRLKSSLGSAHTSAPATLAAATTFMKLLDPNSVVRESELFMALQASGKLDQMTNIYNNMIHGKTLTTDQVKTFGETADQLYNAAEQTYGAVRNQYSERAQRYGLNPQNVVNEASAHIGKVITAPSGQKYKIVGGTAPNYEMEQVE